MWSFHLWGSRRHELRAERQEGGGRTFKVQVGEPLQTSFGEDLYGKIFGADSCESEIRSPI